MSKMIVLFKKQTGQRDTLQRPLVFARDSKDSELFIYLDSVVSQLKLKCRTAVIPKTQYLQWILVKFMTMLQQGLFVT